MTTAALRAVYDRLPIVDLAGLLRRNSDEDGAGVLIIAPHPDDESLGCGGLIALATANGIRVHVALLTDGEASHPNSIQYPPDKLAETRRQEITTALAYLGIDANNIAFLHLPDGCIPSTGEQFINTVDSLARLCQRHRLSTIFCTSNLDPHPDHKAAFAIASALRDKFPRAVLFSYPIWSWTLPPNKIEKTENLIGFRLDISAYVEVKRKAIRAHASQVSRMIDDDPNGFRLDPNFISRFLEPYEMFLVS